VKCLCSLVNFRQQLLINSHLDCFHRILITMWISTHIVIHIARLGKIVLPLTLNLHLPPPGALPPLRRQEHPLRRLHARLGQRVAQQREGC
jgi:hypothetical protein